MTITYTGVNGGTFPNAIVGPADGETVTGASVGLTSQGAANECKFLYDTKVDRAGDTMTGALVVTATAASGDVGITATGDGVADGIFGTGGATSGIGVSGLGGVPNGPGVSGDGSGSGAGGVFTGGATGKGVVCDGGAGAAAIDIGTGHAVFTGTRPLSTAVPASTNLLCSSNIIYAVGMFTTDSFGGVTNAAGYNILSVSVVSATHVLVTFARAFADTLYAPTVSSCDDSENRPSTKWSTRTTSTLEIYWRDAAGAPVDPSNTILRVSLTVCGRQ